MEILRTSHYLVKYFMETKIELHAPSTEFGVQMEKRL